MGQFPTLRNAKKRKSQHSQHYGISHTLPDYSILSVSSLFFLCSNPEEPEAAQWLEEEEEEGEEEMRKAYSLDFKTLQFSGKDRYIYS